VKRDATDYFAVAALRAFSGYNSICVGQNILSAVIVMLVVVWLLATWLLQKWLWGLW
jgi:hypothetical protein